MGILSSPNLFRQVPLALLANFGFATTYQPELGVCTEPVKSCDFPAVRLVDGGYTDNQALAGHVGYMQKKFPNAPLRMIVVDSNSCDFSAGACLSQIQTTSFRQMFAGAPCRGNNCGFLPVKIPSKQIFAENITD